MMDATWKSQADAAASAAAAEAEGASLSAASKAKQEESLRSRAQAVCGPLFQQAQEYLVERQVPTNSRYAVEYRQGWRGALTGRTYPVHLDGWQFILFGACEVWLSVDGRAWRADYRYEPGQNPPRLPSWGKTGYGPEGGMTGLGPNAPSDETYIPQVIEFDPESGELLDGPYGEKRPIDDLLAEAVGRFVGTG